MADNIFRSYRRDPVIPGAASGVAAPARGKQTDDPLAELARLIGQGAPTNNGAPTSNVEPANNPARAARHYEAPLLNAPAADDRYVEPREPAQDQYDERQYRYDEPQAQYDDRQGSQQASHQGPYAERYDTPRLPDPEPPYRPAPSSYAEYDQPAADQYPAPPQRYATDPRGYADEPRYDDEHDSIHLPSFLPRTRDDRYDYAEGEQGDADDQPHELEDYEEEDAPPRRRRGFAVVAALLGLMVLGTAGAFGYRAMFGGSMLPSLPPIIKADDSPNKIVPAGSSAAAFGQANASKAGSPDKLVSREEKPVDVPVPANTPRVVSTIPIFPDPNAGLQSSVAPGSQNMAGQNIPGAIAPGSAGGGVGAPLAIGPTAATPAYGGSVAPAPATALPGMGQGAQMQAQQPIAGTSGSKKVHTVAIHPGQPDGADAAAAAASHAPAPPRPAAPKPLAAAPQGGSSAPLSIVPSQGDTPVAHTRTAVARPTSSGPMSSGAMSSGAMSSSATSSSATSSSATPSSAPSSGGGYSVQVSSQRSEAEAQSAYRGLQAKYPSQLGGHTPTVRQVNLGDKGVYYRTLVGPYSSAEQAAQMCSSLKAAGGSCLVQRN